MSEGKSSRLTRLSEELDNKMRQSGYDPAIQEERDLYLKIEQAGKVGVAANPLDKVPALNSNLDKTPLSTAKKPKNLSS